MQQMITMNALINAQKLAALMVINEGIYTCCKR